MDLPRENVEVTKEQVFELCKQLNLPETLARIEKDYPAKPFKSDGVSCAPDRMEGIDLYPAAFRHDLQYWAGQPKSDREEHRLKLLADARLMVDVLEAGGSHYLADAMFGAVRIGGAAFWHAPWSWGFGRR